jgi:hypothetical protein
MSNITIHTSTTTSRIGLLSAPSTAYIITVILICIIIVILMYFCISENSRNVMITLFYWFCSLILKIIILGPALLALLYCYSYKSFVFIAKKFKKKSQIDIVLHTIVVINNTDSTTDTSIHSITDTINFILKCYSCS